MISLVEILIIIVIPVAICFPIWKIIAKAGYPGIFSLCIFIPIINIVMLYWFSFSEWPTLKVKR